MAAVNIVTADRKNGIQEEETEYYLGEAGG
jgi:hypothetical protein